MDVSAIARRRSGVRRVRGVGRRAVVFLGPSLDRATAASILPDVEFRRPIRRGDLKPLLDEPPAAIGIVDGEFYQSVSVSPKEILPFLRAGVPVFGSSSMGALRAVELAPYGMAGVGTVFNWFLRGRLSADDEVAMTFCPQTFRPLSEPLVNFRVAFRQAQQEGVISPGERVRLSRAMQRRYFPARTVPALFQDADEFLGPRSTTFRAWWSKRAPNAKGDDARDLLARMGDLTSSLINRGTLSSSSILSV
jgi:hypothetical protein